MNETVQEYKKLKGLTPEQFTAHVKASGTPTGNALAEAVWHALSGNQYRMFDSATASKIYRDCGYIAFGGFPLKLI